MLSCKAAICLRVDIGVCMCILFWGRDKNVYYSGDCVCVCVCVSHQSHHYTQQRKSPCFLWPWCDVILTSSPSILLPLSSLGEEGQGVKLRYVVVQNEGRDQHAIVLVLILQHMYHVVWSTKSAWWINIICKPFTKGIIKVQLLLQ